MSADGQGAGTENGMKEEASPQLFDRLIEDGYCRVAGVLENDMLERLRQKTDALLDAQSDEQRQAQLSTGSMVSVFDDPLFAELVAYPRALAVLQALGMLRPKFSSGYVISKPPQSPALFWHQDWWGWNDPCSYTPLPQQLFLMYYLVDTSPHNGCLRLLRGSHLRRHAMHDQVPDAHTDELRRFADPNHPAYRSIDEEVNVPVQAGDLVIGDSRLLHASHANQSDARRTVITLWYHPYYSLLPEAVQARIGAIKERGTWAGPELERVGELVPEYQGNAEPLEWNRVPGEQLL
jgi:ectoine hydroxylase-related dioxygenase (phytanoyl-CoA dioxygenase family)